MKKIKVIMIWVLLLAIAFFIAFSIVISLFGRKIVLRQLENNLQMKVGLESVSLSLPFSINLSNLEVGDLLKAQRIVASPSILSLFTGRIIFSKLLIVNPTVELKRFPDGSFNLAKLRQGGKQPPVLLTGLGIENGKFIFTDQKLTAAGYKIILDRINASVSKVMLPPTSLNTRFKFSADFTDPDAKILGNADSSGWIDFGPKDMDAILQIKDLDLTYFAPYCGNFISNRTLLSAKLNLKSIFKARNNDLNIVANLKLFDISYAKEEASKESQLQRLDITKNALDFFTDENGNVDLELSLNTKLDRPNLNVIQLRNVMLKAAAKNLSRKSPEQIIEKISNNAEQFKEIGKQLKGLFKKKE